MSVQLVSVTVPQVPGVSNAEELIAYCARVSNPGNQHNNDTAPKLLKYLIRMRHWSPFEMASMCVGIETTRAIAAQILRHRSFSFQEFSQRYAKVGDIGELPVMRLEAEGNRQSSADTASVELQGLAETSLTASYAAYELLCQKGVATESARMVLPLCAPTKLYMHGTLRSWIHYLQIRCDEHVQLEHREIAEQIRDILRGEFPTVYEAVFE